MAPVMAVNDDLPIRTDKPIHSGKVRAVYWLTANDSSRLIKSRKYDVAKDAELAIMVISDRISAYECIWRGVGGLQGVPGKGAALNAISNHWFQLFKEKGLANSHILEVPHPLVWVVQRAAPVMIEAICRQYITGSMWRDYSKGSRSFCGIAIPDGLKKDSKLSELLVTPSTKGVLKGIDGVPEVDDVNVSRAQIEANHLAFGFESVDDIATYEKLLKEGFGVISDALAAHNQLFVDTKFDMILAAMSGECTSEVFAAVGGDGTLYFGTDRASMPSDDDDAEVVQFPRGTYFCGRCAQSSSLVFKRFTARLSSSVETTPSTTPLTTPERSLPVSPEPPEEEVVSLSLEDRAAAGPVVESKAPPTVVATPETVASSA